MIRLFEHLKNLGVLYTNVNFFQFSSPNYHNTPSYCEKPEVTGSSPQHLVDGSHLTAWANMNGYESEQYFTVHFKTSNGIFLSQVDIETTCYPPKQVKIEGSDNGLHWKEIGLSNFTFSDYTYHSIATKHTRPYNYFKISQVGRNVVNEYRFHVYNIEFHGTFFREQTCRRKQSFYSICFLMCSLFKK